MTDLMHDVREWLEADGLGGFASGTVCGVRTRRYHAWLLAATTPPTGRMVLVHGADVWVETAAGRTSLSSQRYVPDVIHPDGASRLVHFASEPWPCWTYELADGLRVRQELFVPHGRAAVAITWHLDGTRSGECRLVVRPFLSGRDYHATHHQNGALRAAAEVDGECVRWQTYADGPAVISRANAAYVHAPDWYRTFHYVEERARGLDDTEDAWSPGWLTWDLGAGAACWWLATGEGAGLEQTPAEELVRTWRVREEARRRAFTSPLHRAADAYLVARGVGRTIIAGYPWFTDWGRDTFIALRGLCLATGRLDEAGDILREWAGAVSEGMLPNRFPDGGDTPEYNAVDASLWFIVAAADWLAAARARRQAGVEDMALRLRTASEAIAEGYATGTRFGIRCDADGLIACGVPGVQLTWMDARIGDHVVTPRIGKPVEIQALWINALTMLADPAGLGSRTPERWGALRDLASATFRTRFARRLGGLHDVVDVDHVAGVDDPSIRPNQVFAVGGLPVAVLDGDAARAVVDEVAAHLWTPLGLRSLAPSDAAYVGRYGGDAWTRDTAYHQGTVWPWLLTAFVEAWLRVRGNTAEAREQARVQFLAPVRAHLHAAGIGHVSEIADGEWPHAPGGCPFQAWSVGELLRLEQLLA